MIGRFVGPLGGPAAVVAALGPALQRMGVTSNEAVSQQRGEAVMRQMISEGVKSNIVATRGYGASDPIAPNHTPSGRAQHRRVEVTPTG